MIVYRPRVSGRRFPSLSRCIYLSFSLLPFSTTSLESCGFIIDRFRASVRRETPDCLARQRRPKNPFCPMPKQQSPANDQTKAKQTRQIASPARSKHRVGFLLTHRQNQREPSFLSRCSRDPYKHKTPRRDRSFSRAFLCRFHT